MDFLLCNLDHFCCACWLIYFNLSVAISMYSGTISVPKYFLPCCFAASSVVPLPINGSYTKSPFFVISFTKNVGSPIGNVAGCSWFVLSVGMVITLDGLTKALLYLLLMFMFEPFVVWCFPWFFRFCSCFRFLFWDGCSTLFG